MGSAGREPTELNSGYFSAVQRGLKGNKIAGAGGRVKKKKKRLKGQSLSKGAWTKCRLGQGVSVRWQRLCSSLLGMALSGLSQRAASRGVLPEPAQCFLTEHVRVAAGGVPVPLKNE